MLYAVFQQAVYRHKCAGIFEDLERAKQIARQCVLASDGHHTYEVVPFTPNHLYVAYQADGTLCRTSHDQDPRIIEDDPVYVVSMKYTWEGGKRVAKGLIEAKI